MRSDSPLLSVLMPVYNCEQYVGQAIESVLSQHFANFELLICDDGSSDSSRDVIDAFASHDGRIRVYHNTTNIGKVASVNNLFTFSRGSLVTVHDADDASHPARFEKQVSHLLKDESLVMCGVSFRIITEKGDIFQEVIMPSDFEKIKRDILHASQFHGPTMVLRKSAVDLLYRPFFDGYNEDCDLAFRLIEKGKCINLAEVLYTYRILPGSLSKTITPFKKNLYKMAVCFHHQRLATGVDDLSQGKSAEVAARMEEYLQPYKEHPSLIFRENAAFLMYYHLHRQAIVNSWKACLNQPLKFVNWWILQYCLRKTIFGI